VHGPTLGRDLPDGCERMSADCDPMVMSFDWWSGNQPVSACLYWWRFPPLKDDVWMEVRAPRAPETERVPWWEAFGRQLASNSEEILELRLTGDGVSVSYVQPIAPDGTVEVLKDGEDALPLDGTVEVLKDGDQ